MAKRKTKKKRKTKLKTKAKRTARKAKKGAKRVGKKARRGAKKAGKGIKKGAKRAGKAIKKAAKTDTGRAGIGAGVGALALGPVGAVAGAAAGLATRKKNPLSVPSRINMTKEVLRMDAALANADMKAAQALRKKHATAYAWLVQSGSVKKKIGRTHPMYVPMVSLYSDLSGKVRNPGKPIKLSHVVGTLMIDYHRFSPAIDEVANAALSGQKIDEDLVRQAWADLGELQKIRKTKAEKEQIAEVRDALSRVLKKANPARAFSLETEVKRGRKRKMEKALAGQSRRQAALSEVKKKSLRKRLAKINPEEGSKVVLKRLLATYARMRRNFEKVALDPSSTPDKIARAQRSLSNALRKLEAYADIEGMSPTKLRRLIEAAGKPKAKTTKRARSRAVANPTEAVHLEKAKRYLALAKDKQKRARESGNISSWLSTMSAATRANQEFENAGAASRYALASFDIQREAMTAIEQKCMASPKMRASLNPPKKIKLGHITERTGEKKVRATVGRNIAKLMEKGKYPQSRAVAAALTQAREDAPKKVRRIYGPAPNPLTTIPKSASRKRAREIISSNIATEMAAGKPQKQAVAIALSQARRDRPGLVEAMYGPSPNPKDFNPRYTRPEKPRRKKRTRSAAPYQRKRAGGGKRSS